MCSLDILMMKVMTTTKVLKAAIYKTYIFIISTILSTERKYFKKKEKRNNTKGALFIKTFMLNIFV